MKNGSINFTTSIFSGDGDKHVIGRLGDPGDAPEDRDQYNHHLLLL